MKKALSLVAIMFLAAGCTESPQFDLVIQNVHLFDGMQDRGLVSVAIQNDTIAAISSDQLNGDSVIDASGKFMIPGMVNAHVHVSSAEELQQGYPLGILTLLNMHTGLEARENEWKRMTRDSVGLSALYGSGHAATVPGGHPNQFSPDMETINDSISIREWVDHRIALQADYIKIVRDNHEWMGEPPLPTLSYEQIEEIISYARSQGLKTVVHANTVEEMMRIAEFKPSGFVHMLDYREDYPVDDAYFETLAENEVFVVPTGGYALKSMENAPPFLVEWFSNNLLDADQRAEIIGKYHDYGILIVAGTDAQEGQMNFSDDYFLELKLYEMAGLTNLEILRTATGNAAKAFDLPVGEVKTGYPATFVMLDENPLEDLANLKKINQVWKNGQRYEH